MAIKIDFYGQLILLVSITIMALGFPIWPVGIFYALYLIGPLGIWQLVSAAINRFKNKDNREKVKHLNRYWLYAIGCISACIISIYSVTSGSNDYYDIYKYMFVASLCGSLIVSVYYLFIYKKYFYTNAEKENSGIGSIGQSGTL